MLMREISKRADSTGANGAYPRRTGDLPYDQERTVTVKSGYNILVINFLSRISHAYDIRFNTTKQTLLGRFVNYLIDRKLKRQGI